LLVCCANFFKDTFGESVIEGLRGRIILATLAESTTRLTCTLLATLEQNSVEKEKT